MAAVSEGSFLFAAAQLWRGWRWADKVLCPPCIQNGLQHPARRATAHSAALCRAVCVRPAANSFAVVGKAAAGKAAADKAASRRRHIRPGTYRTFLPCSAACGGCAAAVAEKTGRCRRRTHAAGCAAAGRWRGRSLLQQANLAADAPHHQKKPGAANTAPGFLRCLQRAVMAGAAQPPQGGRCAAVSLEKRNYSYSLASFCRYS